MTDTRLLVGTIGRPHGVRGLVRLACHASTPDLLARHVLHDRRGRAFRIAWQGEGIARVTPADGPAVADRTEAARLTNLDLLLDRSALPAPEADEFYHADLVGLAAHDPSGRALGRVVRVHDYGAGASLEIEDGAGGLIVAFTEATVPLVDLAGGRITVAPPDEIDWHVETDTAVAGAA